MDQEHPAFGIEKLDIVYYLDLAAFHVENGSADEVFSQHDPTLLINKWEVRFPICGRRDEDGVVVNLDHFLPRDEFVRPAHTMLDVDPNCVGKRFGQSKDQVRHLP